MPWSISPVEGHACGWPSMRPVYTSLCSCARTKRRVCDQREQRVRSAAPARPAGGGAPRETAPREAAPAAGGRGRGRKTDLHARRASIVRARLGFRRDLGAAAARGVAGGGRRSPGRGGRGGRDGAAERRRRQRRLPGVSQLSVNSRGGSRSVGQAGRAAGVRAGAAGAACGESSLLSPLEPSGRSEAGPSGSGTTVDGEGARRRPAAALGRTRACGSTRACAMRFSFVW